ncbi:MAG: hypothetical protein U9R38_06725 [Candidatus Margulisiibacteriota bacterium]|nr:hypothetical protein [Candidatus Margulisiibacteriota bacterium]
MPIYRVQKFIYGLSQSRFANRMLDGFGEAVRLLRIPYATSLTRNKAKMWISQSPDEVRQAKKALLKANRLRAYQAAYKLGKNHFREIDILTPAPEASQFATPPVSSIISIQDIAGEITEEPTGRPLTGLTQMISRMRGPIKEGKNGAQVYKVSEGSVVNDFRLQQASRKIVLDDAKPASPEQLREFLGDAAFERAIDGLKQAIESGEKNPRIGKELEQDIIEACKQIQERKRAELTVFYREKGFDLAFENHSVASVFYCWLAEAHKQEFIQEWTRTPFNYDRLIDIAKTFYRHLVSYHAARDKASEGQLPALEERYERIATPREPFYADLLIKDRIKKLSDTAQLAAVLKGLVHECLAPSGVAKSDIDKLPNSPAKLRSFFKASSRAARKAATPEKSAEAIMECLWDETSDRKYIRTAAFAAAAAILGGTNWGIRWGLSNGYIKDKKQKRAQHLNELGKSLLQGAKITPAHTADGDFYFYFRIHSTKDYYAPERIRLGQKTVKELHKKFPDLIFAPELMLKYSSKTKGFVEKDYKDHVQDLGMMSISGKSSKYIIENNIPLLMLDARLPSSLDTGALDKRERPFSARDWAFYAPPLAWGTALALLFTNNKGDKPAITRRRFLGVLGFGAAETIFNTAHYRRNWGPEKWLDPFTIQFRNALFAYKLLVWSRRYKEKHGKKPKLLITFGAAHGDIVKNLKKGEEYNLKIIRRLGKTYGYTQSLLGDQICSAHYYTPNKGKVQDKVARFPKLKSAIPH